MNIVAFIKKIITTGLEIIFFGFVIAMTIMLLNINKYGVTKIDKTSFITIRDDVTSSSKTYKKGDLVLVEAKKLTEIKVGDEVFVYRVDSNQEVTIDVGPVGAIHPDDNAITLKNGSNFEMQFVAGEAGKTYEKIGTYLSVVQSTWGFLFIVLVPSFLIFIYQLYALIVEIKYGKDAMTPVPPAPASAPLPGRII